MSLNSEQQKELWEECGLTLKIYSDGTVSYFDSNGYFICFGYPTPDPTNFVTWVKPELNKRGYQVRITYEPDGTEYTTIKKQGELYRNRDPYVAAYEALTGKEVNE